MRQGRFLDAVTSGSRWWCSAPSPRSASASIALTVHGRAVQVYLGGTWFTVAGVIGALPLAPEIERAALIGYPVAHRLFATTAHASTLYVRADPERVTQAARPARGRRRPRRTPNRPRSAVPRTRCRRGPTRRAR